MSVAKTIEIIADSDIGIEDAVRAGVKKADSSLEKIRGVWVKDIEANVTDGEVTGWRVRMMLTFELKS
ncbi:MAG: dodecin family protein [Sphingomonadaceae bacterium]